MEYRFGKKYVKVVSCGQMGIFATYSAEVYGISFVSEKMIRIARFWIASILST